MVKSLFLEWSKRLHQGRLQPCLQILDQCSDLHCNMELITVVKILKCLPYFFSFFQFSSQQRKVFQRWTQNKKIPSMPDSKKLIKKNQGPSCKTFHKTGPWFFDKLSCQLAYSESFCSASNAKNLSWQGEKLKKGKKNGLHCKTFHKTGPWFFDKLSCQLAYSEYFCSASNAKNLSWQGDKLKKL